MTGGNGTDVGEARPPYELAEPELIVMVRPETSLLVTGAEVTSSVADVGPLREALAGADATIEQLFDDTEERLRSEALAAPGPTEIPAPDLSVFYRVRAPGDLDALAATLREIDVIEAAYVKPPAEPPQRLNDMIAIADAPPLQTPDFTPRQGYLNAAPGGIDARFAWTQPGGRGANVRIIDVEGAWRFTHEDLRQNQGGVIGGTPTTDINWRNHGTAVIGEFSGDVNNFGITGICPDALVRGISIFGPGQGSASAIRQAANALRSGDIILIELHRPGPRFNFQSRPDQRGYIAIEWWEDDFAAIQFATSRGVIVVEAAGNGAESLDDAIYNQRPAGFPVRWTNPFRRSNRDCRAILVGAGAPPSGAFGPDRSRLEFSNYGASLDAQGWGREVTTTGYGDLQGGSNEDAWYTARFSGTSSASPIVVGALGCVQGYLRARQRPVLTPLQARSHLRVTGSSQQNAPGRPATQRIGNRPNLRSLLAQATDGQLFMEQDQDFSEMPGPLARLARLETTVEQLQYSISGKFKPEPSQGALADDPIHWQ